MSQSFNTASVTSTNSEKLFISTDTDDADNLELQALKDREQIKENQKLKEGNNAETKSKPGRKPTK